MKNALRLGLGVLYLSSCGFNADTTSLRSNTTKQDSELTSEFVVHDGGASFMLTLPQDMAPDQSSDMTVAEDYYPLPPEPSSRFSLTCADQGGSGTVEPGSDQDGSSGSGIMMPWPIAKLELTLKSDSGDAESAVLYFYCSGSATVNVKDLIRKGTYGLAARLSNHKGISYSGYTGEFVPGEGQRLEMVMRRDIIEPPTTTDVAVDIVFEDDGNPNYCQIAFKCTDLYQPAVCYGTFVSENGDAVSATKLQASGSNTCMARANLYTQACKLSKEMPGKLIEDDCVVADQPFKEDGEEPSPSDG